MDFPGVKQLSEGPKSPQTSHTEPLKRWLKQPSKKRFNDETKAGKSRLDVFSISFGDTYCINYYQSKYD